MKKSFRKRSKKPSYIKWGLLALGLYLAASLVTVSGPFSLFASPADVNQVSGPGSRTPTTTTRAPRTPSSATTTFGTGGSGGNQTTGRTTGGSGGGSGINTNGGTGGNQTTGITPANGGGGSNQTTTITPANGGGGGNQTTTGTRGGTGGRGGSNQTTGITPTNGGGGSNQTTGITPTNGGSGGNPSNAGSNQQTWADAAFNTAVNVANTLINLGQSLNPFAQETPTTNTKVGRTGGAGPPGTTTNGFGTGGSGGNQTTTGTSVGTGGGGTGTSTTTFGTGGSGSNQTTTVNPPNRLTACEACFKAQRSNKSLGCASVCNVQFAGNVPAGGQPATNPNNGQPPRNCGGGNSPMRVGLTYPTGEDMTKYGGSKDQRACVTIEDGCGHSAVKACDTVSPALVVLPYNAGCEYTDGTSSSAGNCETRANRCVDSDGAPLPSGATRQGEEDFETCVNGKWEVIKPADPTRTGVTLEQCMAGISATEKCVPIQGTGDYGRVPLTAPSTITSVPPVTPVSKSVCYGEKIADIVIESALGASGAVLGPVFTAGAGVSVITAMIGGIPGVINCADKDNPSYDLCREGRYPDAKSRGCKDLPTSPNEKGQPVVQVTKALCDSLPVIIPEFMQPIATTCVALKVGESVAIVLDKEDETPPANNPQSNENNPSQPAQSQSNPSIFTDAPGLINYDKVSGLAGCFGGLALSLVPCSGSLLLGPIGVIPSLACRVLACVGPGYVSNKAGDVLYNVTH